MGDKSTKYFSARELSVLCGQISMILKAAIPLEEGIAAICETMENPRDKKLLLSLEQGVSLNGCLSAALEESGRFPPYMVNMVKIGERAGKLDDVTDSLSLYYEREDHLRDQIRGAVLYPFILILMISAVIAVLVIKVLPVFQEVFRNLGGDLSFSSVSAINIGAAVGKYAFFLILFLAVVVLICFAVSKTKKGHILFSNLAERLPYLRKISSRIGAARFASVLSMLLASGYDTSEALDLLPGVLETPKLCEKAAACKRAIENGSTFPKALEETRLFSGIYFSMVTVGAKTGNLDTVMERLANHYSQEADDALSNAVSMIEPILVGLLSVIIGAILLSVMLPLVGVMSAIG